jgi:hypothetical protein
VGGDRGCAVIVALVLSGPVQALPLYAQRSGRTCANCHVSPTLEDPGGWDNPQLMERKCTMSCGVCHVDPNGGGLRNTSGRYYGASTLGVLATQERPYSDLDRELLSDEAVWRWRQRLGQEPRGEGRTVPSDLEEARAGVGAGQTGNLWAMGGAAEPIRMSYWDGRYGSMNADPRVQLGGDARVAYYTGTGEAFPMQLELHGALHPVHHLTASATLAGRRTEEGVRPSFRRLFALIHELPGMSFVRGGAFQPAFGTLLDDHTAPVRTLFEASAAESVNTVVGLEAGTAPNYPFATASVFAHDTSLLGSDQDRGYGAAVQGGWRDLTWSLSGHAQIRRRRRLERGDLDAFGIAWGLSPPWSWKAAPLTWLGEVTAGRRAVGEDLAWPIAGMSELSLLVRNGVVVKVRSDAWAELTRPGWQQRHGLVLVVSPVPGLTLEGTARFLWTPGGQLRSDSLVQTHLWF